MEGYDGGQLSRLIEQELQRRAERRWFMRTLLMGVLATALAAYLLLGVFFGIALVHGDSMEPALYHGDIVVVSRLGRSWRAGDIVLVDRDTVMLKRIVAVSGDVVDIDESTGTLLVNGEEPEGERYLPETYPGTGQQFPLTVGEGYVLVLGDNRTVSYDSRELGQIAETEIKGRQILLVGSGR